VQLTEAGAWDLTAIKNVDAGAGDSTSRIESIERIDLNSTTANTLTLSATDVIDMAGFNLIRTGSASADGKTWTNVSGTALGATTRYHQLVVDGSSADTVNLNNTPGVWSSAGTVSDGSNTYTVLQNNAANSQLLVRSGVVVNLPLAINTISSDSVMASSEALVVSGTAAANATVAVGFNGQSVNVTADSSGNWTYDATKVRYVMLRKLIGEVNTNGIFSIRELRVFDTSPTPVNIATGKTLSSNLFTAPEMATLIDGDDASIIEKNLSQGTDVWVQVDLGGWYSLSSITTAARNGNSEQYERLIGTNIFVSATDMSAQTKAQLSASPMVGGSMVTGYNYTFTYGSPATTTGADLSASSTITAQQTVSGVTSNASANVTVFGLVSSSPADNGYMVNTTDNLTLTFNRPTAVGTGSILLYNSAGTLVETINVTGSLVTGWGTNTLTINPNTTLTAGTSYYLGISATAIRDTAGNAYAGFSDANTLNFGVQAADGSVVATMYTDSTKTSVGYSVSGAGDVNGDGYSDYLVGGSSSDNSVFVVYGDASGLGANFSGGTIASTKGFKFYSAASQVGIHLSGVVDVNGDGFDDVMLASTATSGLTYVVYGGVSNSGITTDASGNIPTSAGFKITGSANSDLGYSVSGAGDVNGDGIADLIFGANGTPSTTGSAYVMYGQAANRTNYNLSGGTISQTEGFEIRGAVGSGLGLSVSSAGDVNGDGLADVVVSGEDKVIYVVYGKTNGLTVSLPSKTIAAEDGFKITSTENPSEFGWKVASAGDVNGDGLADILVNSRSTNSVYVVFVCDFILRG
jgi:methionine-rich copper-binding protein CopC